MNQKELNEIRRRFKPDRTAISKVYGCYVSSARQIISYIDAPMGLMSQDKYTLLMKRLGQNYFAYRESLMSRDKESLIEKAAEITAMQEAYSYLTTKFEFRDEMLDDVLALENPLKYFADRWLMPVSDVFDVDMDIRENIAGIRDSQEYLCQREPAVSVLARLQNAAQEVRECPAAEKPVRDFGAR